MLSPDLILHGGKIITLDRGSRLAQAISVRSGHIVAVGDDELLLKDAAPTTQIINLAGRSVLPGLFDSHPHADREGLKARGGIPIAGLHSVAEIVDVVKRAAQTTPAGEWIVLMPMGEPPHEYFSRPDQLIEGRFPRGLHPRGLGVVESSAISIRGKLVGPGARWCDARHACATQCRYS
jgi:hypothetical protein